MKSDKLFYITGSIVLSAISVLVLPILIDKGAAAIYKMLYTQEKDA